MSKPPLFIIFSLFSTTRAENSQLESLEANHFDLYLLPKFVSLCIFLVQNLIRLDKGQILALHRRENKIHLMLSHSIDTTTEGRQGNLHTHTTVWIIDPQPPRKRLSSPWHQSFSRFFSQIFMIDEEERKTSQGNQVKRLELEREPNPN